MWCEQRGGGEGTWCKLWDLGNTPPNPKPPSQTLPSPGDQALKQRTSGAVFIQTTTAWDLRFFMGWVGRFSPPCLFADFFLWFFFPFCSEIGWLCSSSLRAATQSSRTEVKENQGRKRARHFFHSLQAGCAVLAPSPHWQVFSSVCLLWVARKCVSSTSTGLGQGWGRGKAGKSHAHPIHIAGYPKGLLSCLPVTKTVCSCSVSSLHWPGRLLLKEEKARKNSPLLRVVRKLWFFTAALSVVLWSHVCILDTVNREGVLGFLHLGWWIIHYNWSGNMLTSRLGQGFLSFLWLVVQEELYSIRD